MNESRFLFVLDMIVLNLLDEGRRTYSLYRIYVLSLIILLALRSTCFSYKAVRADCLKPVFLIYSVCPYLSLFFTSNLLYWFVLIHHVYIHVLFIAVYYQLQ